MLYGIIFSIKDGTFAKIKYANNKERAEDKYIQTKVISVVDGDTIKIIVNGKEEKLRLIGIDTPESVHLDKKKNTKEGKIASEYTKSRLEGRDIKVEFDVQERDKYGRLLRICIYR